MAKILYIGGFELPDKNAAAQRVIGISNVLYDLNNEIYLVGLTKSSYLNNGVINNKFNYQELYYPKGINWIKYLTGYNGIVNKIKLIKPDIVILYNYPSLAMRRIITYCKSNNIKLIGDTTEWYEGSGNFVKKFIKNQDVNLRMKKLNLKLDGQIVISRYLKNYYDSANVIEIPPLFDVKDDKFKIDFEKYDILDNKINLIYSGSPGNGDKDRLDKIIKEVSKFDNLFLNIIGINKNQYQKIFLDLKEYNNVKFHGRIKHIDALNLIKYSDFTVFLRESNLTNTAGFPTKFAESISIGTPVITNSSSNLKEYFSYNIGYEIKGTESSYIVEVLSKISKLNKIEILELKKHCYNSKLFDFLNYKTLIESLFNSI